MHFVALSTSRGTVLRSVLECMAQGTLTMPCLGLITDREDRGCIDVARAAKLPIHIVTRAQGETRETYDERLHAAIIDLQAQAGVAAKEGIVALMGWMRILSPWFVQQYQGRILNVHPSLLPRFPGAHALEDALAARAPETGMTIHLVDEGVDTGPILLQQACPILPDDTLATLRAREQALECTWYPIILERIHTGEIVLP